jgi:flagellar hook-basal body complex protein FliE
MSQLPIEAISALTGGAAVERAAERAALAPQPAPTQSFGHLLLDGLQQVNRSVLKADQLTRAFAVDDSVPLHQVTFALEQARLSVELMGQVRSRLVEGYQELFRMQL